MARILLVDDEDFVRDLLRAYLRGTDHSILEAPDGEAALHLFRQSPTDLVVTDNAMPRLTGLELIKYLHTEAPATKIIAMSGFGLEDAQRQGVDRILPKPFSKEEFLDAVESVLRNG